MTYLITGGAGFIGSHLTDALVARGACVVALDDLSTGSIDNLAHLLGHPRFSFRRGSVLDGSLVAELVSDADAVIHLAASVGVRLIVERPLASLINNVRGAEVVLEACAAHKRRVLVASSSEVYGKNGYGPLAENADRLVGAPFEARWAYATAKAFAEILAYSSWRERGTPTTVVRLFNVVGARQTGAYGMVLPSLVRQALRDEELTVFGDGEQRRCFCHVDDVVRGLLSLLEHPRSAGLVLNVGSTEEMTINELAALVRRVSGARSAIVHVPYEQAFGRHIEDVRRRVPDTTRMRSLTGWRPCRTLREAVSEVVEYERHRALLAAEQRT